MDTKPISMDDRNRSNINSCKFSFTIKALDTTNTVWYVKIRKKKHKNTARNFIVLIF